MLNNIGYFSDTNREVKIDILVPVLGLFFYYGQYVLFYFCCRKIFVTLKLSYRRGVVFIVK